MKNNSWAPARVLDASDRTYLEVVLPLFGRAKKEIVASLYLIEPQDKAATTFSVNRLMEALITACRRGVRVRIYLNTNFRIKSKSEVFDGKYFERLSQAGAQLTALLPNRRLHDKLIVIDGRYVIEGSTNWSIRALESNFESASIIDSREHARKKLKRIEQLLLPTGTELRKINQPLYPVPDTIEVPLALFEQNLFPEMIRQIEWRAVDLYLILLAQSQAQKNELMEIDLETIGQALGLPSEWDRTAMRRQVIKVLRRLADEYRLIEVDFVFAQDARVRIKSLPGKTIRMDGSLFEPARLTQESSGITFLKIADELLKQEGIDINSLSNEELEKRFGVGRSVIMRSRESLNRAERS